MEESILKFAEQFSFVPKIKNSEKISGRLFARLSADPSNKISTEPSDMSSGAYKNFVLAGMGGSHLSAGILRAYNPALNVYIHKDYGMPDYDEDFCRQSLFIASSLSGNTEEIIDFAEEVYSRGLDLLIISAGGKLAKFATQNNLPFIELPNTGIQPRMAIGFSTIALASVVAPNILPELHNLEKSIDPAELRKNGEILANSLKGQVPVIYASTRNRAVAYNWKIKINETAKIPSFHNIFPELNHNEMQGYDSSIESREMLQNFHFIIITDPKDHSRTIKRMVVTEEILEEKGFPTTRIYLEGKNRLEQIFNSLILADWVAFTLSQIYKNEPTAVPLIEEFKKRIS